MLRLILILQFLTTLSYAQETTSTSEGVDKEISAEVSEEPTPQIKRKSVNTDEIRSQSTRMIEHPNASKGLIKIDKQRVYIYRVKQSEQDYGSTLRLGSFEPTELQNPDFPEIDFSSVYTESEFPMLNYDIEKQFFKKFGRLSYTVGFGFYYASGQGKYADPTVNPNEPPLEEFSLFVFPISLGANYRFQFWDTQMLVPYVGGGVDIFTFMEYRDDDASNDLGLAFGAAPAAHGLGGLAIRLGRGTQAFLDLDREYGINSMWVTFEYRRYQGLSSNYDFTSDSFGGGIYLEH